MIPLLAIGFSLLACGNRNKQHEQFFLNEIKEYCSSQNGREVLNDILGQQPTLIKFDENFIINKFRLKSKKNQDFKIGAYQTIDEIMDYMESALVSLAKNWETEFFKHRELLRNQHGDQSWKYQSTFISVSVNWPKNDETDENIKNAGHAYQKILESYRYWDKKRADYADEPYAKPRSTGFPADTLGVKEPPLNLGACIVVLENKK